MGIDPVTLTAIGSALGGVASVGSLFIGERGGGNSAPVTPAPVETPAARATTEAQRSAEDRQRKRAQAAAAGNNTILTQGIDDRVTDNTQQTARTVLSGG